MMRNLMLALGAASLAVPATVLLPLDSSQAQASSKKRSQYREWRGRDGRRYCRRSNGTTGLVVGAVGGAVVGSAVDSGAGTVIGAIGGALAGREIERSRSKRRCR